MSDASEPPAMSPEQYQQTVASLTAALTELNIELREKTAECEALYETANELSKALQESDKVLTEKSLECERLQMKLSMTTFLEVGEEPEMEFLYALEQKRESSRPREISVTPRSPVVLDDLSGKVTPNIPVKPLEDLRATSKKKITEDVMPKKPHLSKVPHGSMPKLGPICVDDIVEADTPDGIRQAHFYNVILERDRANQTVKKLTRELKYVKAKSKELKARLEKSNKMVEISYDNKPSRRHSLAGTDKVRIEKRKWLRGQSARALKEPSEKNIQLITDDEQINKNWNDNYLDAIVGGANDADKAAGRHPHQLISF